MKKGFTILLIMVAAFALKADDEACRRLLEQSGLEYKDGDYKAAGNLAEEAGEAASDTVLKANALQEAVKSYRMGGLLYSEFNAIDKLLEKYANYVDVVALTNRQFDIGDAYFAGKREPAFWSLRWIPWLHDRDKTAELYTRALKRGPFAKSAHNARMRLSVSLIEDGKSKEALEHLREIVKLEVDNPDAKYAYLILGEQLFLLSQRGDGDGGYYQEAQEVFELFKKKFPDAPENDMVDKWILKSKDIQAKRLLSMADFYKKGGKDSAALRYLSEIIIKYPDSIHAPDAEKLLVEMDKSYIPDAVTPEMTSRLQSYNAYPMMDEEKKLLMLPGESGGKYLLPVYDLGIGKKEGKSE